MMRYLVGSSPAMKELAEMIAKAGPSCATVLIQGESGTGKELVARALHDNSPRRAKPFVAFNCAALAESLVESELFGHERGSFTGAWARKIGRFEAANGGTLFFDEIGELSLPIQAKLLRVLEESEVDRIGATVPVRVDIRFIAATNRDLEAAVARGLFREDLLYRVNVVTIRTPPLRERPEDIPALVRYFIEQFGSGAVRPVRDICPEAMDVLLNYSWPGNVRQLRNLIQQAIVLGSTDIVQLSDLPPRLFAAAPPPGRTEPRNLDDAVFQAKRQFVQKMFALAGDDYERAASMLEISRKNMRRFLERLDLLHLAKRPVARKAHLRTNVDIEASQAR